MLQRYHDKYQSLSNLNDAIYISIYIHFVSRTRESSNAHTQKCRDKLEKYMYELPLINHKFKNT